MLVNAKIRHKDRGHLDKIIEICFPKSYMTFVSTCNFMRKKMSYLLHIKNKHFTF